MKFSHTLPILAIFISLYLLTFSNAANFNIVNQCTYTVWAAASPGGGRQLNQGESWSLDVAPGTTGGRIWGRTNCNFDANGNGNCQTGNCGRLDCQGYGSPPNTLAEFALNQPNNLDYIDISNVDGFNIPMDFSSVTSCRDIRCTGPIVEQCPGPLQTPGGCNNPCTVFHTNEYCCTDGPGTCSPTNYSNYFKGFCPDAYSFPQDDRFTTVVFTCPGGTNYRVVFCP